MFIIRNRWFVISLYIAAILLAFLFIPNLRVVYNFRDFFSDNDPELAFYKDFSNHFGTDEQMMMIGVRDQGNVFNKSFLEKFDAFTRNCAELPFVERSYSLTTLKDLVKNPLGFSRIPFLHIDDSLRYSSDSLRIFGDPRIPGWLISEDSRALSVVLRVKKETDEKERDRLITAIDSLISAYTFKEAHIAGFINTETRYVRLIRDEMRFNVILCSIVIIICFSIFFRSFTGVFFATLCLLIAMIIFYGLLGIFHRPINVLSTLFPTIIMVVGTSGLIHIFTFFHLEIRKNPDKKSAMVNTVKELTIRILMTSLTTAIGFLSLITSSMKPIRNFGIEAGIGVMLTFVVAITLFPAILLFKRIPPAMKLRDNTPASSSSSGGWPRLLNGISSTVENHPKAILLVTVLLSLISVIGIINIDRNNLILGNYSGKSEIRQDVAFFEEKFSGIRIFNLAILPAGGKPINDLAVLGETEKLVSHLQTIPSLGVMFSPVTVYKTINKIYHGGVPENYKLPDSQDEISEFDKTFAGFLRDQDFRFMNDDRTLGLISGKMKDIGSEKAKVLESEVMGWIRDHIDRSKADFRFTGFYYLSDRSNDYLIRNMFYNLALAFLIVSILMLILFRNLKILIISLIPNIVPILFGGMVTGFSGIVLNAYVAIVYTIGFVIAVDNTIHFLAKFRIQRGLGQSNQLARQQSLQSIGRAMIMTTLILFFGFLVLVHSELMGVFAQGVLISSILIVALLADLYLLPVLLKLYLKD